MRLTNSPITACACWSTSRRDVKAAPRSAVRAFYGVLAQYTLEDLVRDDAPLTKILFASGSRAAARQWRV